MFKKEYLFVFVVIGLAIAYTVLSLITLLTRGKWFKAANNKVKIGTMIVAFIAMLTTGSIAFSQTETPLPTPVYGTLEPTSDPAITNPPPTINPYSVPTATPTPLIPPYALPPTPGPTPEPTPEPTPTPPIIPPYSLPTLGDVNYDMAVDIIDALLISQYYVGLNPPNFYTENANVDCSDKIDIIDALLVAQQYVGLLDPFPPCPASSS